MWLEAMARDVRHALRVLRRSPGFTAVAVLTLALGIGANTAVFSIINAVLLAELPYADPARLITLTQSFPAIGEAHMGVSPPEYLDYRDRARVFASIAGYSRTTLDVTGDGESEPIDAVQATGSLFATLGVSPQIQWAANALVSPEYFAAMGIPIVRGRPFTDADVADAWLVAVVNETLARRYWPNRDPIGEDVLWGGRRLMIVGVSGDVHIATLDVEVEPTIYCSVYQVESGATTSAVFILRSTTTI
jgi:hypothetical protein